MYRIDTVAGVPVIRHDLSAVLPACHEHAQTVHVYATPGNDGTIRLSNVAQDRRADVVAIVKAACPGVRTRRVKNGVAIAPPKRISDAHEILSEVWQQAYNSGMSRDGARHVVINHPVFRPWLGA